MHGCFVLQGNQLSYDCSTYNYTDFQDYGIDGSSFQYVLCPQYPPAGATIVTTDAVAYSSTRCPFLGDCLPSHAPSVTHVRPAHFGHCAPKSRSLRFSAAPAPCLRMSCLCSPLRAVWLELRLRVCLSVWLSVPRSGSESVPSCQVRPHLTSELPTMVASNDSLGSACAFMLQRQRLWPDYLRHLCVCSSGLSSGAVAGIVIGVLVGVVVIVAAAMYCMRRRGRERGQPNLFNRTAGGRGGFDRFDDFEMTSGFTDR
jgi:hypothetical protein